MIKMGGINYTKNLGFVGAVGAGVDLIMTDKYEWLLEEITANMGKEFEIEEKAYSWILIDARSTKKPNSGAYEQCLTFIEANGKGSMLSLMHANEEMLAKRWEFDFKKVDVDDMSDSNPNKLYRSRRRQSDHSRSLEESTDGNQG